MSWMGRSLSGLTSAVGAVVVALACASGASAMSGAWTIRPIYAPAHFAPGSSGEVIAEATNLGAAPITVGEAAPMQLSVQLPAGVTATSIEDDSLFFQMFGGPRQLPELACEQATLVCSGSSGSVYPYESMEIVLALKVAKGAEPGGKIKLSVGGAGVAPATSEEAFPIGAEPVKFGVERFEQTPLNEDGSVDTQAGSHPFQFTTTLAFNEGWEGGEEPQVLPLGLVRNLTFHTPPGVFGDPNAVPQCPIEKFDPHIEGESECPPDTVVGVESTTIAWHETLLNIPQPSNLLAPVYNLAPSRGEPARLGFIVEAIGPNVPVFLDTSVQSGGDYGVVVHVDNISEAQWFVGSQLSIWGAPGDPRHNASRDHCLEEPGLPGCETREGEKSKEPPFFTLPTSCTGLSGALASEVEAEQWNRSGEVSRAAYTAHEGAGRPLSLDGCDRLGFGPEINVAPDSGAGSTASGLTVDIHVPQRESLDPEGVAESTLRDTTVALPEGVALNPAAADGLETCSESLVGFTGFAEYEAGSKTATFTPALPEPLQPGVNFCPDASKIATANIKTPLLPNELTGSVYLAAQNANPFGSLLAMYIVVHDPISGVLIKVAGEVQANPVTGQLIATFDNNPELPFEDLTLHFFGGNRAPLATPAYCGSYTTNSSFTPWSGNPPATPSSTFDITSGPNGSPCPGANLPFSPELTAGSTSIQAGGFSPFTMTVSRNDGQQNIQQIQLHMPEGLSGLLTGVELCGEAQANAGTCGPNSQIGETTVSVGLGGDPYSVTGGKVYITGPYEGAPFGVSVVVPAKAGPYNLGQVIVRGRIEVNPATAALTVTTNSPSQGYAIPHILDGIPLEIKHVNFVTTRPGFTFNPTNCDPLSVTGSFSSVEGASSPLSVPFQVTNCAVLKFEPAFSARTSGSTSRVNGASLNVRLAYPSGAFGKDANIATVKVELPKQLPSRLTTLQKACAAATFEANPAGCPAASIVGHAKAVTPLIPVPLEGPAYFVSYGGEAFPNLIMVLQGYGVTLDLVGTTFINKAGITSSTFKTVPDAPVGSFELTLPEGPYSALSANSSLCQQNLVMPTAFVAQNGATLNQSTHIEVSGCAPAIHVVSHKVKGRTATIKVSVPGAGKLTATGRGLSKATGEARGASTLTLKLTLSNAEVAILKKHRGRKLAAHVKLTFIPKEGGRLHTSVTVLIG